METNKKNLFLDDFRYPEDVTWVNLPKVKWEIVRSVGGFKEWVNLQGVPKIVAFDNDLLPEHYTPSLGLPIKDTGYEAALWLVELCEENNIEFPSWIIHSLNSKGVTRMRDLFNSREISWIKGLGYSYSDPEFKPHLIKKSL